MPIVVIGAGAPSVIREDEDRDPLQNLGKGIVVIDGSEPVAECPVDKPVTTRKRRA